MKRALNLLTERYRIRRLVRRRLRVWGLVWLAAALVASGWCGDRAYRVWRLREAVAAREAQAAPLRALQSESARIRAELDLLHRRQSLLALLEQGKLPYQVLALVSDSTRRCDRQIQVRELTLSRTEVEPPAPAKPARPVEKPPTVERIVLTLHGVARDNHAVARFVAALRDGGLFDQVDLQSTARDESADREGRSYLVECALETVE